MLQKKGSSSPYHSSNSMSRLIPLQSKGSMSATAQKIMSARMLRVKQLQNELSEAQLQLSELAAENRALRTLQKRQEVLLKRYESKQAALPQIMHSYEEEVRILSSRLKQARAQIRTLEERLRTRDNELSSLKDKCHHLEELSQSKHLRQREQLQQRLELLQDQLHEKEKTVQLLTRKVMLEGKNYKHQLAVEATRHRTVRNELANALEKISELEIQLKKKDKFLASSLPRPVSLLSLQTPTRFRGFQSQTRTEIVQVNHSNHMLEEEDDEDDDGEEIDQKLEDDQQQDYSESSYTDPHTNTSQMSSLENGKEMGGSNLSNVSMSLDYQAKRLQFSNHYRKNANAVQETTYTDSANGLSSRSLSLDQPKLETDTIFKPIKEDPFHPETDRSIGTKIESSNSSILTAAGNFTIQNGDGSRKGSQSSLEDEKKKGKNLEFLSSLASDMNINGKSLKYQTKFVDQSGTGEDTLSSGEKIDIVPDSSTKEDKGEDPDIQAKHNKKDSLTESMEPQCLIRKNSLSLDNHKDIKIGSRRSSVENVAKGSAPADDTPPLLQEISQSWEELGQRMKSDSWRVKSEVEKHLLNTSAMVRPESQILDESKKKALLDALKAIDDGKEPLVKRNPTIPSSLFMGSVRDSSPHSKPFTSQQLSKRKKNLLDDLFPNSPPDILVDPVADGVEPTVFKRN